MGSWHCQLCPASPQHAGHRVTSEKLAGPVFHLATGLTSAGGVSASEEGAEVKNLILPLSALPPNVSLVD